MVVPPATPGVASTSVAEQITRLERTIQSDTQRITDLNAESADPEGEYQQAEQEFRAVELELAEKQDAITTFRQGDQTDELRTAEEVLRSLEAKHDLARQRFDLAIQTRKTVQEQVAALEEKIRRDQQALDKLTGADPPQPTEAQPIPQLDIASGSDEASQAAEPTSPTTLAAPVAAPGTQSVEAPTSDSVGEADPSAEVVSEPESKELREAQQIAAQTKEEAHAAELEAQSISERIETLDKTIALERKLFEAARKKADIAYQQQQALQAEHQEKSHASAPAVELRSLERQRTEAAKLFNKARDEVAQWTDRLNQLQAERTALQADELVALRAAEEKKGAAAQAEEQVGTLKNPFSIHNMLQWLLDHGLRVTVILCGILFLRFLLRLSTRRLVDLMVKTGARGTQEQREDRARTLIGVFQNAGSLAIVVGGTLMICDEVGIAVGPLMGGAAVVGLAVAFGAQNLIRDYFYGFVILLENQYKINDILRIGDTSGQVERITLRMTVLRDLEGRVHFIPNGKIDSVTNMTHGWSRAVFEIGVAYKEDADEVMNVLMELAQGLREDPQTASMILEDPEMLGVDALGDSAVVIKFVIKTRPLKQWAVKRELLRRIKRRFDELGIEIPFPHRTIYHQHAAAEPGSENAGEYDVRRAA